MGGGGGGGPWAGFALAFCFTDHCSPRMSSTKFILSDGTKWVLSMEDVHQTIHQTRILTVVWTSKISWIQAAFNTGCEQLLGEWECGIPLEYKGYNYNTVRIGDQCWFAENLRSKEWRDFDWPLQTETEHCYPCDGPAFYTYGNDLYDCDAQHAPVDACYAPFSFEEYGLLYNGFGGKR